MTEDPRTDPAVHLPRVRMVVQPTVSHYREPLIRELLASPRADFSLFGIRGASGTASTVDRIRDASDDVLDRVELVETYSIRQLRWERGVVRNAIRGNFDALVLEGRIYTLSTLFVLIVGRILKRPVFLWGHGWKRDERGFKRLLRLTYYRMSRGLLLYGEEARVRALQYGLDPRKLHVVGNSIYSLQTLEALPVRKTSSNEGGIRLIVSCRLTSRHRIELLAEALESLEGRTETTVTVIGDGGERAKLEAIFAAKGLKAEFLGSVFDERRLATLYDDCDLAVSPAASGLNVIQAMGFATPVVVPDVDPAAGPEQEAVVDGRTGLRFRHGDARDLARVIAAAAQDKAALHRMGATGRGLVEERYVAERHAQAITDAVLADCESTAAVEAQDDSREDRRPRIDRARDAILPGFLVMLLSAGYVKGHPWLSWLPFDLTAAAAALTLLALVYTVMVKRGVRLFPRGGGPLLALLALLLTGYLVAPSSEYADQKRVLLALMCLAAVAGLYLIDSRIRLIWLLRWIVAVGLVVALFVWVSPVNVYGRVSFEGGGTITVARATGGALVALLALTLARNVRAWVGVVAAAPLVLTLSGTGQRAPLLAVAVAVLVLGVGRPGPNRLRRVIITLVTVGLAGSVAYAAAGDAGRARLNLLFQADQGASVSVREQMWSQAWASIRRNPLGIGWGQLDAVVAPYQHPHNLFLEVTAEAGWAAGVAAIVVAILAVLRARRISEDPYCAGLLMLFVFTVLNALVSGDVVENRAVFALAGVALVAPWSVSEKTRAGYERAEVSADQADVSSSTGAAKV